MSAERFTSEDQRVAEALALLGQVAARNQSSSVYEGFIGSIPFTVAIVIGADAQAFGKLFGNLFLGPATTDRKIETSVEIELGPDDVINLNLKKRERS